MTNAEVIALATDHLALLTLLQFMSPFRSERQRAWLGPEDWR